MGTLRDRLASGTLQRWVLLGALLLVAAGLLLLDPVDRERLVAAGERFAARPLALPALVALQAGLFTFGLPGALVLWLVAPFFSAPTAIAALLCGSLLGGLGARALGAWLGEAVRARYAHRRAFRLLARRSDLWTQAALRVLPGFPHSVVNFGAGVLGLALGPFLAAAALGYAVKWAVYVAAVRGLVDGAAEGAGDGIGAGVLWPLAMLAAFLLGGSWLGRRVARPAPGSG